MNSLPTPAQYRRTLWLLKQASQDAADYKSLVGDLDKALLSVIQQRDRLKWENATRIKETSNLRAKVNRLEKNARSVYTAEYREGLIQQRLDDVVEANANLTERVDHLNAELVKAQAIKEEKEYVRSGRGATRYGSLGMLTFLPVDPNAALSHHPMDHDLSIAMEDKEELERVNFLVDTLADQGMRETLLGVAPMRRGQRSSNPYGRQGKKVLL